MVALVQRLVRIAAEVLVSLLVPHLARDAVQDVVHLLAPVLRAERDDVADVVNAARELLLLRVQTDKLLDAPLQNLQRVEDEGRLRLRTHIEIRLLQLVVHLPGHVRAEHLRMTRSAAFRPEVENRGIFEGGRNFRPAFKKLLKQAKVVTFQTEVVFAFCETTLVVVEVLLDLLCRASICLGKLLRRENALSFVFDDCEFRHCDFLLCFALCFITYDGAIKRPPCTAKPSRA